MDADFIPAWLKYTITANVGGAGVRLFAVWLEAKRLSSNDRRESMSARIRSLEARQEILHDEIADLRCNLAVLETENRYLQERSAMMKEALRVYEQDSGPSQRD